MIRALWFLARLSLLVFAVGWLAARPGWITVDWLGYRVELAIGFAAAALSVLLLGVIFIDRLWRGFVSMPATLRRYRYTVRREKGYRALTSGLVSVAAGDPQGAERHAKKAEALIPATPLTKLLTAQTALLNGNAPKARREFTALLEDGEAAFFGLRGLLTQTLKDGSYGEAQTLIRKAEALQPKRVWVVRTRFDIETRNKSWPEALEVLKKAEKMRIYDAQTARRHRQSILTAQAMENEKQGYLTIAAKQAARAAGLDYGFAPASVLLADLYDRIGKKRAALRTIEKAWKAQPHPAVAALWMRLMPPPRKAPSVYDSGRDAYQWARRLGDLNPQHSLSQRLSGHAALDASLWKEARERLTAAADFRALAKLERAETGNEAKAREWLERAEDYPPEPRWICDSCGHVAAQWSVLCGHCAAFDALGWTVPQGDAHKPQPALALPDNDIIAPPAQLASMR
ncbi:MAG: heme biosynthesis HemY N-terminal domain-containing protein [Alphaproteobacteria bacterium]|nr:heme biosynthesis HemY N-terminal domain-containing protein [Alphaproteobacteria bacterium]